MVKEERQLVLNRIRTPDGTILTSNHRHDYQTYTDKNGLEYMVDGGDAYLRRNLHTGDNAPEELSLYTDDPFEILRENVCRGGRGKDSAEPLKWVPIAEINDAWLENLIEYQYDYGMKDSPHTKLYEQEVEYRKEHSIKVKGE